MLISCDSVILIYLLEYSGPYQVRTRTRITAPETAGNRMAVSDLSRLECRIKPIRGTDMASLVRSDQFVVRPDVCRLPLTTAVYDRATLPGAALNLELAGSLHLSAAIEGGWDRFLTNECRDIPVEVLPP